MLRFDLAERCFEGRDWVTKYKKKWGDIIGGRDNDGFISVKSQSLTSYTESIVVDHVRSAPPKLLSNDKFETTNVVKTDDIYGEGGKIDLVYKELSKQ